MENKKNMCVLFSAFDFDRRFVFRGAETPLPVPEGKKGDKKGEVKEKPDTKKALGELTTSVEAKEKSPEKPYSITKLDEIRRDLLKAKADMDAGKEFPRVLIPLSYRLKRAGNTLQFENGALMSKTIRGGKEADGGHVWMDLIDCADRIERIRIGESETDDLVGVAIGLQANVMMWIDPTTRQEQEISVNLTDKRIQELQERLAELKGSSMDMDIKRTRVEATIEQVALLEARKAEVQAMKLPQ